MEIEIALQELGAAVPFSGVYQAVHQALQLLQIGFGDQRACPLQRQGLQLDAQRVQLPDFVRIERSDEAALVLDPPDKTFMLQGNQRFPHDGCAHVHLAGNLTLHDHLSGFQQPREEGVFQRGDDSLSERDGFDLWKHRVSVIACFGGDHR